MYSCALFQTHGSSVSYPDPAQTSSTVNPQLTSPTAKATTSLTPPVAEEEWYMNEVSVDCSHSTCTCIVHYMYKI